MKKIAVGDLGEFWYGDYKEPFVQLEGAIPGYPRGVLLRDDEFKPLCAYCGKTFHNLGNHVSHLHGMKAAEYKREIGLLQKTALVSEATRQHMIAVKLRGPRAMDAANANRRPGGFGVSSADRAGKRSPEYQNKTGTCHAQMLAVGRSILRERGKVTQRDLAKRAIYQDPIRVHFGTFENYMKAIGAPQPVRRGWTKEQLVLALRSVAMEIGFTPSESDLKRHGLPSRPTYQNHFGSYTEACRQAGLTPNLPRPMDGELDLAVLSAYATIGSSHGVARAQHLSIGRVLKVLRRFGYPFPAGYTGPGRKEWAAEMAQRLA